MGWDGTIATHYKNGRIDRKAKCDERLTWSNDKRAVRVVKSTLVGSTYYAAVEYKDIVEDVTEIVGAVILTSVDGREILMKVMQDTSGPCACDCPVSILNLLTPTDSEWANEWRDKCRAKAEDKKREKKDPRSLKNLPENSVISFVAPWDMSSGTKRGDKIRLTKRLSSFRYNKSGVKKVYAWSDGYYRWPEKVIPKDYVVEEVGE